MSNLPLVSSTCEAVSRSYTSTKESLPLLKGVMDAAESGVRTLGAAASTGSKPLLDIIEPQRRFFCLHSYSDTTASDLRVITFLFRSRVSVFVVATVNEYALKGLDKMEEKLPVLHQPANQVRQEMLQLWGVGGVYNGFQLFFRFFRSAFV